jgi:hypothetical protein
MSASFLKPGTKRALSTKG